MINNDKQRFANLWDLVLKGLNNYALNSFKGNNKIDVVIEYSICGTELYKTSFYTNAKDANELSELAEVLEIVLAGDAAYTDRLHRIKGIHAFDNTISILINYEHHEKNVL